MYQYHGSLFLNLLMEEALHSLLWVGGKLILDIVVGNGIVLIVSLGTLLVLKDALKNGLNEICGALH